MHIVCVVELNVTQYNSKRPVNFAETHIKPGVKEHAEDVLSKLSKKTKLFLKLNSRLASVRKEMRQKLLLPRTNDMGLPLDDDLISKRIYNDRSVSRGEVMDIISDASSDTAFSQSSQISSTSGYKNVLFQNLIENTRSHF